MTRFAPILLVCVLLGALAGCGTDSRPEFATAPPNAEISQLDVDGHSVAYGSGADEDGPGGTGFASQVARALALEENNLAVVGATLQESGIRTDGWGKVLRSIVRSTRDGTGTALPRMALLMYGANDVALFGPDLALAKEAYRSIISRHRSSAVFEAGDSSEPSIVADAGWEPVEFNPGEASGGGALAAERPESLTIETDGATVPGGAAVALGFVQTKDTAARYTVSIDGKREDVLSAKGPLDPKPGQYVPEAASAGFVLRIEDFPSGKHTIEVAADRIDGEAFFDYWQVEPPKPEPVVLVEQYRLPSVKGAVPPPEAATNVDFLAVNRMAESLAKEFGPRVITVDTDRVVNRSPRLLFSDGVHPSQRGHDAIAQAVLEAIRRSPFADELESRAG